MDFLQNLLQTPFFVVTILITIFVNILLIGGFVWLFLKTRALQKRQDTLFNGKSEHSAEGILLRHSEEIAAMETEIQELFERSKSLHHLGQKSLHRIGFIRFNPFKDVGSNQSFSLALLDGKCTGVVISSLHTRDGSRVYAKPVESGQSTVPLTEEEKTAISIAQNSTSITTQNQVSTA